MSQEDLTKALELTERRKNEFLQAIQAVRAPEVTAGEGFQLDDDELRQLHGAVARCVGEIMRVVADDKNWVPRWTDQSAIWSGLQEMVFGSNRGPQEEPGWIPPWTDVVNG